VTPSFELDQDHLELQAWLHVFAADVIRPAAHDWDEREEFPWPVLEEAARIGVYSLDYWATQSLDERGIGIPITMEELFWGDAGIGLSIVGTTLAAARRRPWQRERRAGDGVDPADVRQSG
jgi:alkylation response protein AidB-like acyl-CoA dehydrogenase